MFQTSVDKLYIGKSQLKFILNGTELQNITEFQNIKDAAGWRFGRTHLGPSDKVPDIKVNGVYHENYKVFVLTDASNLLGSLHNLYVTGIPKDAKSLDPYRLKDVIWSSYYEDDYRGYLFQVVSSSTWLSLNEV